MKDGTLRNAHNSLHRASVKENSPTPLAVLLKAQAPSNSVTPWPLSVAAVPAAQQSSRRSTSPSASSSVAWMANHLIDLYPESFLSGILFTVSTWY